MPDHDATPTGLLARLKNRGVLRVAFSYAVIAWLVLQIGDVVLDPFEIGAAVMKVLLVVVTLGFPVALALAWFFELTPSGIEVDKEAPGAPRPAVAGVRRYADIVIIGALVIAVAFLLARQGGLIEEEAGEPVVAVLPFDNMSPEAEDAYFGEGLADTLIHRLGQLSELVVLASQSTFQFKGRDLDLGDVGAKLGATVIMLGSVQRAGNALRVNARLVEVGSGKQLWSGSFDRGIQDVFAIQDEIATSVTDALHLVLAPQAQKRLTVPETTSLTAYDAYVLGLRRLADRRGETRLQALEFFRQAIAADPDYALAYAGVVEALWLMGQWSEPYGWKWMHEEADRAASRALALDPQLGEAWMAKALVAFNNRLMLGDETLSHEKVIALFEKAIELSPNNAMAHKYFANYFTNVMEVQVERKTQLIMKAARLDPRSGIIKVNVGESFLKQGDLEQAEAWFRDAAHSVEPYFAIGYMAIVRMHMSRTGRLDEAARWGRAWVDAHPDEPRAYLAATASMMNLGAWEEAQRLQRELADRATRWVRPEGSPWNLMRFFDLTMGSQLQGAMGELEAAAATARQLSSELWEKDPSWPVLQDWGWSSWGMTALALDDVRHGRAREALDRHLAGYPGGFDAMNQENLDVLHPPVMMAALHKQLGEPERARVLLEAYLDYVRDLQLHHFIIGKGWSPFTILAMLGETEAALDEFENMVNAGYMDMWWALKDGAFDPDYAAVIADPRFEELYGRITTRVDELREAYFAQPELPEGYMR